MSHLWITFYGYQYLRNKKIPNAKFYSSPIKENNNPGLDPWFITGITDAEGCFLISVLKDSEYKLGWQCRVKFKITLHSKDFPLLLEIQQFFGGVGSIQNNPNGTRDYIVTNLKEITTVILPHFLKYSLLTQKAADFLLFKMATELILAKTHLTLEGLHKIVAIKAKINTGLSQSPLGVHMPLGTTLQKAFPNIIEISRPLIDTSVIPSGSGLQGLQLATGLLIFKCQNLKVIK